MGDDTLDVIMLKILQNKLGIVGQVLDGEHTSIQAYKVAKGEVGHFEPSVTKNTRATKITDYFQPCGKDDAKTKK